MAFINRKATSK